MTREEIFELIDQTIFPNSERAISPEDVNSLLKSIYDSVQINTNLKRYRARLSSNGTNPPTVVVYENTIGTLTWTYHSTGVYKLNSSNLFPANKTFLAFTQGAGSTLAHYPVVRTTDSIITLTTTSSAGTPTNGGMADCFFEIVIYP